MTVPFLKWVGGKRKLVNDLKKHFPTSFRTYHEPFVGGGAVFFALGHRPSTLTDINPDLVWTYQVVRDHVEDLITELTSGKYIYDEARYYQIRAEVPVTAVEQAARFIYLNRTGFNGLYRVNAKGKFNVPFGRYTNPTICDEAGLRTCSAALQGVGIYCGDFMTALKDVQPGDLVYCDPPYVPLSTTSSFTSYSSGGFNLNDQARLMGAAKVLKALGATVVLSNSAAPFVRDLYQRDFRIHEVLAARAVNSKGAGRGKITELILT